MIVLLSLAALRTSCQRAAWQCSVPCVHPDTHRGVLTTEKEGVCASTYSLEGPPETSINVLPLPPHPHTCLQVLEFTTNKEQMTRDMWDQR